MRWIIETRQASIVNVYCPHCRGSGKIVDYSGSVKGGDLLLTGNRANCVHEVAHLLRRVLKHE